MKQKNNDVASQRGTNCEVNIKSLKTCNFTHTIKKC